MARSKCKNWFAFFAFLTVWITDDTVPTLSCGRSRRPSGYGAPPLRLVPSVLGLVGPEEVDVPVEMHLEVPRRHPCEAP